MYRICFPLFAGSGTIIPDPDPGKSSGSMRIRIHNTGHKNKVFFFACLKDAAGSEAALKNGSGSATLQCKLPELEVKILNVQR